MPATGLGLLLATIVRTESQATSYSKFRVVVLATMEFSTFAVGAFRFRKLEYPST
jgi:hypothetical protein